MDYSGTVHNDALDCVHGYDEKLGTHIVDSVIQILEQEGAKAAAGSMDSLQWSMNKMIVGIIVESVRKEVSPEILENIERAAMVASLMSTLASNEMRMRIMHTIENDE